MIVLFEQNNTLDDTMAYDYAYKLMELFVDANQPRPNQLMLLQKKSII